MILISSVRSSFHFDVPLLVICKLHAETFQIFTLAQHHNSAIRLTFLLFVEGLNFFLVRAPGKAAEATLSLVSREKEKVESISREKVKARKLSMKALPWPGRNPSIEMPVTNLLHALHALLALSSTVSISESVSQWRYSVQEMQAHLKMWFVHKCGRTMNMVEYGWTTG